MSQQNDQKWKYFILNINIEAAPTPPSPEEASRKLKGRLSPSFIQDQFPKEYKKSIKVSQCMSSFKKRVRLPGHSKMGFNKHINNRLKVDVFFKKPDNESTDQG